MEAQESHWLTAFTPPVWAHSDSRKTTCIVLLTLQQSLILSMHVATANRKNNPLTSSRTWLSTSGHLPWATKENAQKKKPRRIEYVYIFKKIKTLCSKLEFALEFLLAASKAVIFCEEM